MTSRMVIMTNLTPGGKLKNCKRKKQRKIVQLFVYEQRPKLLALGGWSLGLCNYLHFDALRLQLSAYGEQIFLPLILPMLY